MSERVCIISSVHTTFDTRIFEKEAKSLREAGYNVHFYTPHERSEVVDGIRIVAFPQPKNRLERVGLTARMAWKAAQQGFDVYHIHDPELLPAGVALELSTAGSVIYDVHENYELTIRSRKWIPRRLRPVVSTVFDAVEGPLSTRLSGVIAASPDIAHRFADNLDVETVTNYPPRAWASDTTDPAPSDTFQISYVGAIAERRGALSLINGVSKLAEDHNVRLVYAGAYGDSATERAVEAELERHDWFEFRGWLSIDEVLSLLRTSDAGGVCIHPTDENLCRGAYRSNKLFQYMSAGIPVIAPDMGNWPDVVTNENCGVLVDPENPLSIAAGIESLLQDPERARELGENGRQAILERYNWETQEKRLLEFYRQL